MAKIVKVSNDYFVNRAKGHEGLSRVYFGDVDAAGGYFQKVSGQRYKNFHGLQTFREVEFYGKTRTHLKEIITEATTGLIIGDVQNGVECWAFGGDVAKIKDAIKAAREKFGLSPRYAYEQADPKEKE